MGSVCAPHYYLAVDLFSEGSKGNLSHFEMLFAERYSDDGDIEQHTKENVGEPYPYTTDEKPQHIHKQVQASMTVFFLNNRRAERPQFKHTDLDGLQSERYADDGHHHCQSC